MKVVKWSFLLLAGLVLGSLPGRADPAGDLYNQGLAAAGSNDYKTAAQDFDQIITNYPSTPNIHDVRMQAGVAHVRLQEYDKAITVLAKEILPNAPSPGMALYYTGLAQLELGIKQNNSTPSNAMLGQTVATFTKLINLVNSAPTDENRTYLEQAFYNRALAYFYREELSKAEADVQRLLQPPFNVSLSRPDYQLLLGNLFARDASEAQAAKKPDAAVRELAGQSVQAFDQTIGDQNALVQANEARLQKAEVLRMIAGMDLPSLDGYQKTLDAYHEVRRKADLIPLQEQRLATLRAKNAAQLQANASGGSGVAAENALLIEREEGRLADLKSEADPIIQALIGIAECYNDMKQGDEARTVLHRLAGATLPPDEQRSVDFALIYSYVLGGETAKADAALSDYLTKHPGDPQAEGLSVEMASDLIKRKDFNGALAQANRSLKDFAKGKYAADAVELKAAALKGLGQIDAAKAVVDDFLRQYPNSPVGPGLLLTRAQGETESNDLNSALADYDKVRNNTAATPELQASGAAGYINTLQALNRTNDVISESQAFATKFPNSPLLPNVLVLGGVAMDKNHDPGAVAALQDVAKKFPADDENSPSPFALYYVMSIYQRNGNVPAMIQAAADLSKAFPARYTFLMQAADAVSAAYVKQKKFDLAIAEYQPLTGATDPEVAATAQSKIGGLWYKAAKSMGAYQSMQDETQRTEAEKRLGSAEGAFINVLKGSPDQLSAVDDAFQGLNDVLLLRRSWGLLKEPDFDAYLAKVTSGLADPAMQTRIELARAGLVFIEKDGPKQYPAALARFRAAISANPSLRLTRTEADRYGELLLSAKDYATAQQVYTTLLESDAKDPYIQADGDYGLGATLLAQGKIADAAVYFSKMKALPGGGAWNPHILDANYGVALAAESSTNPADLATAKQTYAALMQAPSASPELQAKAMLGYGDILVKEGHPTDPATPGTTESAVFYYKQVDTIFGPAVPVLSAQGLYQAAQLYDKAGDAKDAQACYQSILTNYATTAPDWAAKAQAAGH